MAPRVELQSALESITENVYFQPPQNSQIQYPCIIYERDGSDAGRADNVLYRHTRRYQVTVIDRNPDSELPDMVEGMPLCRFDRFFTADSLNHHVFNLFF
jgi:hypothetical protein